MGHFQVEFIPMGFLIIEITTYNYRSGFQRLTFAFTCFAFKNEFFCCEIAKCDFFMAGVR